MAALGKIIEDRAAAMAEGTPLTAKEFLDVGTRAAVDQALSRLARQGVLERIGRGLYARPVASRYGTHAPSISSVLHGLAIQTGAPIAASGAAAANALGLTTQVPVKEVYLTTGRSRRLQLGGRTVELRHAPPWQLVLPGRVAGDAVRALAWAGRSRAPTTIQSLRSKLTASDLAEVASARARLPTWVAQQVSDLLRHA